MSKKHYIALFCILFPVINVFSNSFSVAFFCNEKMEVEQGDILFFKACNISGYRVEVKNSQNEIIPLSQIVLDDDNALVGCLYLDSRGCVFARPGSEKLFFALMDSNNNMLSEKEMNFLVKPNSLLNEPGVGRFLFDIFSKHLFKESVVELYHEKSSQLAEKISKTNTAAADLCKVLLTLNDLQRKVESRDEQFLKHKSATGKRLFSSSAEFNNALKAFHEKNNFDLANERKAFINLLCGLKNEYLYLRFYPSYISNLIDCYKTTHAEKLLSEFYSKYRTNYLGEVLKKRISNKSY